MDFGITGTLGDENGKAVGWVERCLVCLVRGLREISSTVRVILGTSSRNRNRVRVVRNRINWNRNRNRSRSRSRGLRTRLAPSLHTLTGHMTGLLTVSAQALQMTRFFTNSAVDGLARVPGTTNKTKYV